METGRVKELRTKHGYGFIQVGYDEEVFFRRKDCQDVEGFDSLHEGEQVEFELDPDSKPGVLRACNVRVAASK